MNAFFKLYTGLAWSVVALTLSVFLNALPVEAAPPYVDTNTYRYTTSGTPLSNYVKADGTLEVSVNNRTIGNLKKYPETVVDVYSPGMAILDVNGYDLNSLNKFTVRAVNPYGAPSGAYSEDAYFGLLIIGNKTGSSDNTLSWDLKNFNSHDAGFGAMVQFGNGVVGNTGDPSYYPAGIPAGAGTPRGENVVMTLGGDNVFGSYTAFGGRGTSYGGNATIHILAGSTMLVEKGAEIMFGGGTHSGKGGDCEVYFDGGTQTFLHQNIYFGGNAKMGKGGKALVEYQHQTGVYNQRVVYGGIGFLHAGFSEVNYYEGSCNLYTYDSYTESNYRGVYFSAMSYYDGASICPNIYGQTDGTRVNFYCGNNVFNMLTLFGGSYDLDKIGGGDKDRTWGGNVEVNFYDGKVSFCQTTKLLPYEYNAITNPDGRKYYRYEGGTYFGGPASRVVVNFSGGQVSFVGDANPDANRQNYIAALAAKENLVQGIKSYTRFNSTNYADEVQFGGRWLTDADNVHVNTPIAGVDNFGPAFANTIVGTGLEQSTTVVNFGGPSGDQCGRVYFDNVRATFGGRVGYYTRDNSYIASRAYNYGQVIEDYWEDGLTSDFFTDNNGDRNINELHLYSSPYNRSKNLFEDRDAVATVNLGGKAEIRVGTNALLIGLATGTSFNGNGGTLSYDVQIASGLSNLSSGTRTQLDVGTLYFDRISLNGTKVDVSVETIQNLTEGRYKSDVALTTDNPTKISVGGAIFENNRFYKTSLDITNGAVNEYSLLVDVTHRIGFYDENWNLGGVGNVGKNADLLNDIIYHHSGDAAEVANALKEILKRSGSVKEDARNFDLYGGAIYADMAQAQVERMYNLHRMLAMQSYMADAGRSCGMGCCDPCGGMGGMGGGVGGGCGYSCGGAYCGDYTCGSANSGNGGENSMVYDEYGNPYPVFNNGSFSKRIAPRFTLWAGAYGFNQQVKDHKGFSGFSGDSFGGIFGLQIGGDNFRTGVYYSYGQTKIGNSASMGRASINSTDHTIGVYAKWLNQPCNGYLFVTGDYSFGGNDYYRLWNQDSCTFREEFGGDYNSHTYSMFCEKGWEWCFCCRWIVNPYLNCQYVHYAADSFTENRLTPCRDPLELIVGGIHYNSLRTTVGVRLGVELCPQRCADPCDPCNSCDPCNPCANPCVVQRHSLKLMTNVGWVHEWLDGAAVVETMSVAGKTGTNGTCPLNTNPAVNLPNWRMHGNGGGITWVNFGLGLNYNFCSRLSVGVNYDLLANGYTAVHSGMAAFGVHF